MNNVFTYYYEREEEQHTNGAAVVFVRSLQVNQGSVKR